MNAIGKRPYVSNLIRVELSKKKTEGIGLNGSDGSP